MNFVERAERFPPVLCRLLARHLGGPALTTDEIHNGSGFLSHYYIGTVSSATTWDFVPFGHMLAFLKGCRINFCDHACMKRLDVYMKRPGRFLYLKRSPEFESTLRPLLLIYRDWVAAKIKGR